MTFVYPALLAGLVLTGIPVLLHLIMRQKPKHILFPALRFLRERQHATKRRLRLRHLLLLALRMLLIAGICLALARPKLFSERFSLGTDRPVAAVLLFDNSYSMQYSVGGKSRLDEAKQQGLRVLGLLPESSRIAVLDSAGNGGDWLMSTAQAHDQINSLELQPASGSITSQLAFAYSLFTKLDAQSVGGAEVFPRLLYVFSDRTHNSWDPGQIESLKQVRDHVPPPEVHSVYVDVGVDQPADAGITAIELPKPVIAANEVLSIHATVQATGAPCDTEILCTIDQQTPADRKPVHLEAGQRKVFTFERAGLVPGFHQAELSLATTDALPFNDRHYCTVEVLAPRRVLVLADSDHQATIWTLALQASKAFTCDVKSVHSPEVATLSPADLANYKVVCLLGVAHPTPDLWSRLLTLVKAGGSLAVIPGGNDLDRDAYELPQARELLPGVFVKILSSRKGVGWYEESYRHPIMASFRDWKMNENVDFNIIRPVAYRYWEIAARPNTAIVTYDDKQHHPALLEGTPQGGGHRGRVLLFSTPLDDPHLVPRGSSPPWDNYLQNSFFLTLANKTVGYLAGDADPPVLNYTSGQTVHVRLPAWARSATYKLEAPGTGSSLALSVASGDREFDIPQVAQPGNYSIIGEENRPAARFSINVPADESILDRVPTEQIADLLGDGTLVPVGGTMTVRDAMHSRWNEPVELLPWIMILVLLGLAVENLLSNRFYRQPKTEGAAEA